MFPAEVSGPGRWAAKLVGEFLSGDLLPAQANENSAKLKEMVSVLVRVHGHMEAVAFQGFAAERGIWGWCFGELLREGLKLVRCVGSLIAETLVHVALPKPAKAGVVNFDAHALGSRRGNFLERYLIGIRGEPIDNSTLLVGGQVVENGIAAAFSGVLHMYF